MAKYAIEPITAITGKPGHGKTLLAVDLMTQFKDDGLTCYNFNIPELQPQYAQKWDGPIERWSELPEGSVLFVDECHNVFPKRAAGKPVPAHVALLAEIRHKGIRVILLTQDFRDVDEFIVRRVGCHLHVANKTGHEFARVHETKTLVANPAARGAFNMSEHHTWRYPKHLYGSYKSSTLHLRSKKWPFKIKMMLAAVVGLVIVGYFLVAHMKSFVTGDHLRDDAQAEAEAKPAAPAITGMSSQALFSPPSGRGATGWSTADEFIALHTPVVEGVPWSAPVFSGLTPTAVPDLLCVMVGNSKSRKASCRCYTEQVTPIHVEHKACVLAARGGVYNPYRTPFQQGEGGWAGRDSGATRLPAVAAAGVHSDRVPDTTLPAGAAPPVPPFTGVR